MRRKSGAADGEVGVADGEVGTADGEVAAADGEGGVAQSQLVSRGARMQSGACSKAGARAPY